MFELTVQANQAGLTRVMEQLTRRQIARRLNIVGNESVQGAERQAALRFTPRQGNRRTHQGAHVHGNFRAEYTDLSEFARGTMQVTLSNRSPIYNMLELGTGSHDIFPINAKVLSWPGMRKPRGVKFVHHPGSTKGVGLMENVIASNLKNQFPGLGRTVTFTS